MKYKIGKIGYIEIIHSSSIKSQDILVTLLFRMKNAYRDFSIYLNGIKDCIEKKKQCFPSFKSVCLIDNTIEQDIISKLIEFDMEIIRYHFHEMVESYELIGFIVRYIFFFDFEWNNSQMVSLFDVDAPELFFPLKKQLDIAIKYNKKSFFHYTTGFSSDVESRWKRHDNIPPLLGEKIICDIKLPNYILCDFIYKVFHRKLEKQSQFDEMFKNGKYKIFPYGVDEYFMNHHVIEYILDSNIKLSYYTYYFIPSIIFNTYKFGDEEKKIHTSKLINSLYQLISKNTNKDEYYKLKQIRYTFFNQGSISNPVSKLAIDISNKYYEIVSKCIKYKDYSIYPLVVLKRIMEYKRIVLSEKLHIVKNRKIKSIQIDLINY